MTESTAKPWVALLAEVPLATLLPIVRVVRAAGACSLDRAREVLAIHADRIVAFRVRRLKAFPPELFEPCSFHAWQTQPRLEPHADLALDQIAHAAITGPEIYGNRWLMGRERGYLLRVTATDGAAFGMRLPEDDAQAVIIALRTLLGARFAEDATLPPLPADTRRLLPAPRSPLLRVLRLAALAVPLFAISIIWGTAKFAPWIGVPSALVLLVALPLLLIIVVLALSNRHSGYAEKRRAERRRAKRKARPVHAGEEPVRSLHLSWLLKGLGAVALFGAFVVALLVPLWTPFHHFDSVLQALAYIPATLLIYYGYRLGIRSAGEVRQTDSRPPILYLRSFGFDGRNNLNPTGLVAQSLGLEPPALLRWLGPVGNIYPLRLVRLLFSRSADHAEEQVAGYFRTLGPFIAIGRPGDRLAFGGAARVYLDDADWRGTVQRLMDEAALIVIQPDDTEQMWWEIRETFQRTKPENVLFLLIGFDGAQWRYERFRVRFEKETGRPLPRALGTCVFLHFTPTGPQLLPAQQLPHIAWPVAGCSVDFPRTLAPFFAAREGRSTPVAPPPPPFLRGFSAFVALAVWVSAFTALYYFTASVMSPWQVRLKTEAMVREAAAPDGWRTYQQPLQWPGFSLGPRPALAPYTVALPRSWGVIESGVSPLAALSGVVNVHRWLWKGGAECFIQVLPGGAASGATTEAFEESLLASLRAGARAATIIEESTIEHDSRTWRRTRLRLRTRGVAFDQKAMELGLLFIPEHEQIVTLWTTAGADTAIQIRITAVAPVAAEMGDLGERIFRSFHYESPEQEAERRRLAERRVFTGRKLAYTLALAPAWQETPAPPDIDRLFSLGNQAAASVFLEELPSALMGPHLSVHVDRVIASIRRTSPPGWQLDDRSTVTVAGQRWERLQFRRTVSGQTLRYTLWGTIVGSTAIQINGWTPTLTQAAHDSLIEPVFAGFTLPR